MKTKTNWFSTDSRIRADNRDMPVWAFDKAVRRSRFAFVYCLEHALRKVLEHLISYSGMSWDEIERAFHDHGKSKNQHVQIDRCSPEAQDAFQKMFPKEQAACELLYSIRCENRMRLFGLRDESIFICSGTILNIRSIRRAGKRNAKLRISLMDSDLTGTARPGFFCSSPVSLTGSAQKNRRSPL